MEQKIKIKYKVLFYRQDVDNKIQMKYWLSEGFDPEFPGLTKEINPIVEPMLISAETESDKEFDRFKYRPIKFERTDKSPIKAPPCMAGKKVVEVIVDKTSEEKFFIKNVWKAFDCVKFSASTDPVASTKPWRPHTVADAARKWKQVPAKGFGTIGDTLNQDVSKLVNSMFKIDHAAIAADVNRDVK